MAQEYTGEVITAQPYAGPVVYDGPVVPDNPDVGSPWYVRAAKHVAKNLVGTPEALAQIGTSMVAEPVAGYAGFVTSPFVGSERGKEIVEGTQRALTYQPKTELGQTGASIVQWPFEKIQQGFQGVSDAAFNATEGAPDWVRATVGAGVNTLENLGLMLLPIKGFKGKAKPGEVKPGEPAKLPATTLEETPVPAPAAPAGVPLKGVEKPATTIGDAAEPLFTSQVAPNVSKGVASLAKDFFEQNPGLRDPTRLISDDIHRYVAGGAIPEETLAAHGLKGADFADIWRQSITEHARAMGQLSQVWKQARETMTPEEFAKMQAAGAVLEDGAYVRPFWKKVSDAWRGFLTSQPATASRNAQTQAGRVGLDVLQAPIDNWLQRLTGKEVTAQPMDGLNEVMSLFQKNKANTDKILQAFPSEKDRLFQRYLSDVDQRSGKSLEGPVWDGIQTAVNTVNILNRTQEFIIRRAIFQSTLDVQLRNRGLNLQDIIENNRTGRIPEEAVTASVDAALSKTFGESPKAGTWQAKLIDAVNALPGANIVIPFPRFMYNALKFQYEYSPMGVLSYLSKAEREAFAAGDMSTISKATIGTGLLGAAFMFRNSEYAGEKWYEAVSPESGNVHDLRPFNPFASYLFVADVVKKMRDDQLYKLTGNDIAQGILSTNMRAGTGLYLLDNALNLMSKTADEKKWTEKAKELTGDFLAGFLTPLKVLRDAYDQFTDGMSIARDTRQDPLTGPSIASIPGLSQSLPEAQIPTRAGPMVTEDPLLRQITGVTTHGKKNPVEKEFDRLGFDRREILASTGDKEVDRKYSEMMGIAVEGMLSPVVETPRYLQLPDDVKGAVLHEAVGEIRNAVKKTVNESLPPEKQMEIEVKHLSPRIRLLLKDLKVIK